MDVWCETTDRIPNKGLRERLGLDDIISVRREGAVLGVNLGCPVETNGDFVA